MARNNKNSSWIFLGAALLAGAAAFWLSHVYLTKQEEKLRAQVAGSNQGMVQVVVATKALAAGALVDPSTMSIGRLPRTYVSKRFVTTDQFAAVQGHALVRDKAAGEPLLMDDVGGAFVERFSDLLKPGERAVTVEATELNADAGLLLPGDHIDMYIISKQLGSAAGQESQSLVPLLEDVHVLAAGIEALKAQDQKYQTLNDRNSHYDSITVAVSVADAERLVLARKASDLAYLLRNSADQGHDLASRINSAQLDAGAGAPSSAAGTERTYEYFSVSQPSGVLRSLAVPASSNTSATPNTAGPSTSGIGPVDPATPAGSNLPAVEAKLLDQMKQAGDLSSAAGMPSTGATGKSGVAPASATTTTTTTSGSRE